jgi:hypothetical protein
MTTKSLMYNFLWLDLFHRATLRRGFAFSTSINNKNPPLVKSRNVTSLNLPHQHSTTTVSASQLFGPANSIQVVYDTSQSYSDVVGRNESETWDLIVKFRHSKEWKQNKKKFLKKFVFFHFVVIHSNMNLWWMKKR